MKTAPTKTQTSNDPRNLRIIIFGHWWFASRSLSIILCSDLAQSRLGFTSLGVAKESLSIVIPLSPISGSQVSKAPKYRYLPWSPSPRWGAQSLKSPKYCYLQWSPHIIFGVGAGIILPDTSPYGFILTLFRLEEAIWLRLISELLLAHTQTKQNSKAIPK